MENGWYFPSSYEEWKRNGSKDLADVENELDNGLISNHLLVNQPLLNNEDKPRKKKKKRRNGSYETFHDKYLLSEEVLGRGANSLVSLAMEKKTEKNFAVKIIEKYDGYDRYRVLTEIDLLHFLAECPFYLVFERMEGGPLLHHIQKKKYFTEREASLVVKDIATALKFLHDKGIAHRDLKPDNILCIKEDAIIPVVICDFNLASGLSLIESATTPELYTPVGSAEYMAPEIVDAFVGDAPAYDKRCDLWSLGVILYIMLSGKPPFEGNCGQDCDWNRGGECRQCQSILWHGILDANFSYPEEGWSNVSLEAKDLISHLLVKEAAKRYTVDNVLSHPWLAMASDNCLNTPDVLIADNYTHRLSAVTSEAIAYRRIISERQNNHDHNLITRWSTPPKFGLSPPGNSRLAKRRSLKNKLNSLSLTIQKFDTNVDSPNNTPIQSPDIEALINSGLSRQTVASSHHNEATVTDEMKQVMNRLKMGLDFSPEEYLIDSATPLSTPRAEISTSRSLSRI